MVCGQAQPQKTLPKTTVNNAMNTIKMTMPKPKMKKSCGQKMVPNKINFRSSILIKKRGW